MSVTLIKQKSRFDVAVVSALEAFTRMKNGEDFFFNVLRRSTDNQCEKLHGVMYIEDVCFRVEATHESETTSVEVWFDTVETSKQRFHRPVSKPISYHVLTFEHLDRILAVNAF